MNAMNEGVAERQGRVDALRKHVAVLEAEVSEAEERLPANAAQRAVIKGIWLTLSRERLGIKSPTRDPQQKRRARLLGLSLEVIHYGLYRLEGTGVTLEDIPLGSLMRAAGYGPNDDVLPYRGSLLD